MGAGRHGQNGSTTEGDHAGLVSNSGGRDRYAASDRRSRCRRHLDAPQGPGDAGQASREPAIDRSQPVRRRREAVQGVVSGVRGGPRGRPRQRAAVRPRVRRVRGRLRVAQAGPRHRRARRIETEQPHRHLGDEGRVRGGAEGSARSGSPQAVQGDDQALVPPRRSRPARRGPAVRGVLGRRHRLAHVPGRAVHHPRLQRRQRLLPLRRTDRPVRELPPADHPGRPARRGARRPGLSGGRRGRPGDVPAPRSG